MSAEELVRAWRDEDFRLELESAVAHPAGDVDRELYVSTGAASTCNYASVTCSHIRSCAI
jgi:mersacidin/lichenicidin family type 2 lantibiotic